MNNPTLGLCCEAMIGRADIEESKSNVAMNAWLPQASSVLPQPQRLPERLSCDFKRELCPFHSISRGRRLYLKLVSCTDQPTPLQSLKRLAAKPSRLLIDPICSIFTLNCF